jgi:prepilin-type processing-associated H-X9-DG protein/prepilin-type N-terminal cleavage/methylation domain-containing protein
METPGTKGDNRTSFFAPFQSSRSDCRPPPLRDWSTTGRSVAPTSRFGFTLIELLIVIAIIAILAALLLPPLARGKAAAKSAACKSNLRQLGLALNMYVGDYDKYPGRRRYSNGLAGTLETEPVDKALLQLAPYLQMPGNRYGDITLLSARLLVWHCPAVQPADIPNLFAESNNANIKYVPSYGYNGRGTAYTRQVLDLGLSPRVVQLLPGDEVTSSVVLREIRGADVLVTAEMIAFGDDSPPSLLIDEISPIAPLVGDRHGGGANVAFCDGHVEYAKQAAWTNAVDTARERWNIDHKPHSETW